MRNILFYTIERELYSEEIGLNGNKTIRVYEAIGFNNIKLFCEIESVLENNSQDEIQYWLDNNGYCDDEFLFEEL
jgi:hypothetical protein